MTSAENRETAIRMVTEGLSATRSAFEVAAKRVRKKDPTIVALRQNAHALADRMWATVEQMETVSETTSDRVTRNAASTWTMEAARWHSVMALEAEGRAVSDLPVALEMRTDSSDLHDRLKRASMPGG